MAPQSCPAIARNEVEQRCDDRDQEMKRDPEQDGRCSARVGLPTEDAAGDRLEDEPGRHPQRGLDRKDRDHLRHRGDRSDDEGRDDDGRAPAKRHLHSSVGAAYPGPTIRDPRSRRTSVWSRDLRGDACNPLQAWLGDLLADARGHRPRVRPRLDLGDGSRGACRPGAPSRSLSSPAGLATGLAHRPGAGRGGDARAGDAEPARRGLSGAGGGAGRRPVDRRHGRAGRRHRRRGSAGPGAPPDLLAPGLAGQAPRDERGAPTGHGRVAALQRRGRPSRAGHPHPRGELRGGTAAGPPLGSFRSSGRRRGSSTRPLPPSRAPAW